MDNEAVELWQPMWGDFVDIHVSPECPAGGSFHAAAEFSRGLRGRVEMLGGISSGVHRIVVRITRGLPQQVGRRMYFTVSELTKVDPVSELVGGIVAPVPTGRVF